MPRRALHIAIGAAVGALCIWLALRNVPLDRLWATLRSADLGLLAVAVALFLAAQVARAAVWVLLARPTTRLPLGRAVLLLLAGNLGNLVVPLRGGELTRVWLLGVRGGVGSGRAASIILVERTVDMLVLFGLVAAGATVIGMPDWMGSGATRAGVAGGVALVGFLVIYLIRKRLTAIAERLGALPRVGPALARLLLQFSEGLSELKTRSALAAAAAVLLSWTLVLVGLELRLRAFGIVLPLGGAVAVLAAANVVMSVSVVPAGIGVFEYATMLCLELLGVASATGLAFAAASHGLTIAVLAIAGTVALILDQALTRRGRGDELEAGG